MRRVSVTLIVFAMAMACLLAQSATYPAGVVSFTTKTAGQTIQSAHVNTIQAEITAIENALINGLAHVVKPLTDATYDLGTVGARWRDAFFSRNVTIGGTVGVTGTLTVGGGLLQVDTTINDFRLTLTTATPVTTSDVTAATSVFWTPTGRGNRIALYDGAAAWNVRTSTELSIAVPATTSTVYDVFVFDNSGTPALELLAWSSTTARATAVVLQDGVWVKSGATTRRLVGSIETTTVSGQTEDSAAKRLVSNVANRTRRPVLKVDASNSWPYTLATFRQADNASVNQVTVLATLPDASVEVTVVATASNSAGGVNFAVAIGENSTIGAASGSLMGISSAAAGTNATVTALLRKVAPLGVTNYVWLELSVATGLTTWLGTGGVSYTQSGITGWIDG